MKIRTVMNIELSSICNNKCRYCPAPQQTKNRPQGTGFMDFDTFSKAIEWAMHFVSKGTQTEVNLFGIGEPTMNPRVVEMVRKARLSLPMRIPIHFNTNGKTMTAELARELKDAGITHIDITDHDAYDTARCIKLFVEAGIQFNIARDFAYRPNDWAGQVDWFKADYQMPCPWLANGQVMVMSSGHVTTCCFDTNGKGIVGTLDDNPDDIDVNPFSLCEKCHQIVPEHMKQGVSVGN